MRSDWASVPTRGSRFAGLDSMIITSVSGAGFFAQPAANATSNAQKRKGVRSRESGVSLTDS